jgi:hypothetical protein
MAGFETPEEVVRPKSLLFGLQYLIAMGTVYL